MIRPGGGQSKVTVYLAQWGGSEAALIDRVVPGLMPYESRLYFGARTGGLSASHDIANINVSYVGDPAIVLADEPTANLDSAVGMQILDLFRQLAKREGRALQQCEVFSMLLETAMRNHRDPRIQGFRLPTPPSP